MKINKQSLIFLFVIVAVTTFVKVLCAPNINFSGFSATLAIALLAGFITKDIKSLLILPLVVLLFSDMLIQVLYSAHLFAFAGFYSGQWVNYLLIASLGFVGMLFRKGKLPGIIAASVIGPAVFFLASNFLVWQMQGAVLSYSKDFHGLMQCYTEGVPFYRNSVIATLIFLPAFIGLYQWIVKGKISLSAIG